MSLVYQSKHSVESRIYKRTTSVCTSWIELCVISFLANSPNGLDGQRLFASKGLIDKR